ncbi:MAG: ATP-binding cassette domain-containing protein, partial [Thermoplasmata archaeon]|nr:ATP-binding cassette domain-containing protein [Thermoplasmata archaeon]
IFGLLGPNGAGKTTTIRMLATLTKPTGGSATIAGYDVLKQDDEVRKHIGLVSEKMIMYDQLTAEENLKFYGKLYGIPDDVLNRRIYKLLKFVGMEKWAKHQIGTFSTGMKQRINVIRALLNQPEVLFLDEPTLGLDPQTTREIREIIRRINIEDNTTIILTTHIMIEAEILCDRIGIIDHGKIVALDTPENLKKMVAGDTIIELDIPNLTSKMISEINSLSCIKAVATENDTCVKIHASGDEAFDDIIDTIRKNNGKIRLVRNIEPTLEDVFLYLTGRKIRDKASEKVKINPRHRKIKNRIR